MDSSLRSKSKILLIKIHSVWRHEWHSIPPPRTRSFKTRQTAPGFRKITRRWSTDIFIAWRKWKWATWREASEWRIQPLGACRVGRIRSCPSRPSLHFSHWGARWRLDLSFFPPSLKQYQTYTHTQREYNAALIHQSLTFQSCVY